MSIAGWSNRLPEGVSLDASTPDEMSLLVTLPVDDDGLWPMRCPAHPDDHGFKMPVQTADDTDGHRSITTSAVHCPYCGHQGGVWDFSPEQHERMTAAAQAAAHQYVSEQFTDMLSNVFGAAFQSGPPRSGISMTFTPGTPPPVATLPAVAIDETRRTLTCTRCGAGTAVYGLAFYCSVCGHLTPAQRVDELLRVQEEALNALVGLPDDQRRALAASGVLTSQYEGTVTNGFSGLETYLRDRFVSDAPTVRLPQGNVFQRLDEAAGLYRNYLGVDLVAALGDHRWAELKRYAAKRHVLTHAGGVVDARYLRQYPDSTQKVGERVVITASDAIGLLDLLRVLAKHLR